MGYADQVHDDYLFLMCCNLNLIVAAWEGWDGVAELAVNGREVNEWAMVCALQDLGYDVVI